MQDFFELKDERATSASGVALRSAGIRRLRIQLKDSVNTENEHKDHRCFSAVFSHWIPLM